MHRGHFPSERRALVYFTEENSQTAFQRTELIDIDRLVCTAVPQQKTSAKHSSGAPNILCSWLVAREQASTAVFAEDKRKLEALMKGISNSSTNREHEAEKLKLHGGEQPEQA